MDPDRKSSRREFLTGRSAAKTTEGPADAGQAPRPSAESPVTTAGERAGRAYLVQISRRAMAVDFQVYLNAEDQARASEPALDALELLEELEQQMSVFRPDSEISEINRRAAVEPVVVEPRLFELLQQALALCEATGGAFDMTTGPLTKIWGFHRRQGRFPRQADIAAALQCVGCRWVALDAASRTIRFLKSGVEINVNAIGKGHALDRCAERLRGAGIEDFLIHGGQSSVLASGCRSRAEADAQGWTVAVRHPLRPRVRLAEIRLRNRALGTSGSGTQFFYHRGRRYGHVLDPRTGWPAQGVLSATVLAPTAAEADALSTAFYVLGLESSAEYCASHPELSAILVCPGRRKGSVTIHAIGLDEADWTPIEGRPGAGD